VTAGIRGFNFPFIEKTPCFGDTACTAFAGIVKPRDGHALGRDRFIELIAPPFGAAVVDAFEGIEDRAALK
jgi:hypothetical protein